MKIRLRPFIVLGAAFFAVLVFGVLSPYVSAEMRLYWLVLAVPFAGLLAYHFATWRISSQDGRFILVRWLGIQRHIVHPEQITGIHVACTDAGTDGITTVLTIVTARQRFRLRSDHYRHFSELLDVVFRDRQDLWPEYRRQLEKNRKKPGRFERWLNGYTRN